jgi:hypothetical protein
MTTPRDPNQPRDPDQLIHAFLDEGPMDLREQVLDEVRSEVDLTEQRTTFGPWRNLMATRFVGFAAVTAVAAAAVIVGLTLSGGGPLIGGDPGLSPSAQPSVVLSPRLPLLARGVFVTAEGEVTLQAIAEESSVTGRMWVVVEAGSWFDVDLQCTRTTEDGLIMIGGVTTDSVGSGSTLSPAGTFAGIVLERGSPVQAIVWSPRGGPASGAASCLANLDEKLVEARSQNDLNLEPIEGFVELGVNTTPAPSSALLARGSFVPFESGAVDLEATGEGSSVTGRMTVSEGRYSYTVDLQCARTTEDGLIMIGGYVIASVDWEPEGTLAAIVLQRGSPVQATIWSQKGGDTSRAPSCLAYLDENLAEERTSEDDPFLYPIEGTVELPASVEPSSAGDGSLPVGSTFELMVPDVPVPNADLMTVTIPAPGWYGEPGGLSVTKDLGPDGRATVTVLPPEWFHVPTDMCRWQSTTSPIPGTAEAMVAALAAQTYETPEGPLTREPSTPVDITIDGDPGQSITLVVPTWQPGDPGDCDEGRPFPSEGGTSSPRFCSLVDRDGYACWLSHLEPGYLDTLWVMGSGDSPPWVIDASFSPTASSELRAEIDAIVDSISTSNVPPFGPE